MEGMNSYYSSIETEEISESTIELNPPEQKPVTLWNFHGCKLCPYKTMFYTIMRNHLKRHYVTRNSKLFSCDRKMIEWYKCSNCDYKTSLLVNFNKHVEVSHHENVEIKVESRETRDDQLDPLVFINFNLINSSTSIKSYSCDSCNFKTYSQLVYINHYTKCPLNETVNSNSIFRQKRLDREFLQWHHFHNRHKPKEVPLFQCPKCPYRAKRRTTLDGHVRFKHTAPARRKKSKQKIIKLYLCEYCSYFTPRAMCLRAHLKTKHAAPDQRRFHCELCPFKTSKKACLAKHVLYKHKKTVRYYCEDCPYKSIRLETLQKHVMLRHEGLNCESCTYKTTSSIGLKEHILKNHVKLETVVYFKCLLCKYMTVVEEELKEHIEKHVRVQSRDWLRCELCTYKYKQKAALKRHILNSHF